MLKAKSRTGLDFAPGTTDECKRLVAQLFTPTELFGAYRQARHEFKNGDLVLSVSESDPSGFDAEPRIEYLKRLRRTLGSNSPKLMPVLGIAHRSAHDVVHLPFESDAFWLVVLRGRQELPIMCVIFATPFAVEAGASA